jgi:hypothetical protein
MDLNSFSGKAFPLGASLALSYDGTNLRTMEDGSVWLAGTGISPFAYTSDYATCPSPMKIPHSVLPGPRNGAWYNSAAGAVAFMAYDPSNGHCTGGAVANVEGDATNGYSHYTSSDGGANWTRRTLPNLKAYTIVCVKPGLLIGVAQSSTTNGVITSTNGGVSWASVTGISIGTISDLLSDGASNHIIVPSSGTAGAYSTDNGASWSASTFTATPSNGSLGIGAAGTWNAGAGLFIALTGTSGSYQTSPTGATWTARATQATFLPYQLSFTTATKLASSATVTVAMGVNGFFATTTDGLTWANHGFISTNLSTTAVVSALYYDGTRFVALFTHRLFYSTDGVTWTEALPTIAASAVMVSSKRLFSTPITAAYSKVIQVTDVTATTPQTIVPLGSGVNNTFVTHYRIK